MNRNNISYQSGGLRSRQSLRLESVLDKFLLHMSFITSICVCVLYNVCQTHNGNNQYANAYASVIGSTQACTWRHNLYTILLRNAFLNWNGQLMTAVPCTSFHSFVHGKNFFVEFQSLIVLFLIDHPIFLLTFLKLK